MDQGKMGENKSEGVTRKEIEVGGDFARVDVETSEKMCGDIDNKEDIDGIDDDESNKNNVKEEMDEGEGDSGDILDGNKEMKECGENKQKNVNTEVMKVQESKSNNKEFINDVDVDENENETKDEIDTKHIGHENAQNSIQNNDQHIDDNENDDEDDFGDFSDASFDDFEAASPVVVPVEQLPSNSHTKLPESIFQNTEKLNVIVSNLIANVYPVDLQEPEQPTKSDTVVPRKILSPRSEALWKELVSIPRLAPPDWKRSSIRRHFLISIGVPIDLDEVLPTNAPVDMKSPSIASNTFQFVFGSSKLAFPKGVSQEQSKETVAKNVETKDSKGEEQAEKEDVLEKKEVSENEPKEKLDKEVLEDGKQEVEEQEQGQNAKQEVEEQAQDAKQNVDKQHVSVQSSESDEKLEKDQQNEQQEKSEDNDLGNINPFNSSSTSGSTNTSPVNKRLLQESMDSLPVEKITTKNNQNIPQTLHDINEYSDENTIFIRSRDELSISDSEYQQIIANTNSTLSQVEENLQSATYYETLFSDGKHDELANILEQLQKYESTLEKTLSVWGDHLHSLNKDHETFEAVVENVVGYTQKVRREESSKNSKELHRKLKHQSQANKKTGFFWNN